jgi:hypothetical protein
MILGNVWPNWVTNSMWKTDPVSPGG